MDQLTRALLLVMAFVALQASALGGVAACALLGQHASSQDAWSTAGVVSEPATSRVAMRGMAMGDTPASPVLDGEAAETASPNRAGGDAPCGHAGAPENCDAMPACAVFVASASIVQPDPVGPRARGMSMVVLAPASPAIAPEYPPPRA